MEQSVIDRVYSMKKEAIIVKCNVFPDHKNYQSFGNCVLAPKISYIVNCFIAR